MSKEREVKDEKYVEDFFDDEIKDDEEVEEVIMTNWEHLKGMHKNNKRWIKRNGKKILIWTGGIIVTIGLAAAILSGNDEGLDVGTKDSEDPLGDIDLGQPMDINIGDTSIHIEPETVVVDESKTE